MNDIPHHFTSGLGLWAAAKEQAKRTATTSGASVSDPLRQFVYERFLARVFRDPSGGWVLKGGTAVLARVAGARHTMDIDLLHVLGDLNDALSRLRAVCAVDLGDLFHFEVTRVERVGNTTQQPDLDSYKVHIDAYCGTAKRGSFNIDLVTGSLMTTSPEERESTLPVRLPGLPAPTVRLYPVVDHIADKLCATQALHGPTRRPSSRTRDLVDLVTFARTQDVDGADLTAAIEGEWAHRNLPGCPFFDPPADWATNYPSEAARTPWCAGLTAFADATAFVAGFLTPALNRAASGRTWSAAAGSWSPAR